MTTTITIMIVTVIIITITISLCRCGGCGSDVHYHPDGQHLHAAGVAPAPNHPIGVLAGAHLR